MLQESPLGQKTVYVETYSPEQLYPIPRTLARDKLGLEGTLPFKGVDQWTGFELSWLNSKGKPEIALAEFTFPYNTPHVVESKSFKLYLNSFNQSKFDSVDEVRDVMQKDLSEAAGGPVDVKLYSINTEIHTFTFKGICLDDLDIETDVYSPYPQFLTATPGLVEETVFSHLVKSNCLATGQPDWGSVLIKYKGPKIHHEGLLKYIISLRRHAGFAEHLVEQIYMDILTYCKPEKLTVYGRYTRRGGLDINPFRSNFESAPLNKRLARQ
jgi:7-cyano-7-deazaguanine reductase